MANINVTYDQLNQAASTLTRGKEDITQKLNDLKGYIDGLVESGYVTDQSSGAFHEKYVDFTTGTAQVVSGIDGLAAFLNAAAETLSEADSQLAQSIRNL